jgi:beta-glucanase (GH16 family)
MKNCKHWFQFASSVIILILLSVYFIPAARAASGWNLTFSDEFNGTSFDTAVWDTQYTFGCTNNDELECYQAGNVSVSGGQAHLTAKKQTVTSGGQTFNYTSGLIQNKKSFTQTYGYFEARMKIPAGQGFWPAFWTLPSNNSWPPEIDITEILANNPNVTHMTLHWGSNNSSQGSTWTGPDFSQGFHVFAVDWEPGVVTWYVDGVQRYQIQSSNVPTIPMYLLVNLAVGGSWPGNPDSSTVFPNNMDIDYVRVYTKVSNGGCYAAIPGPTDPIPNKTCTPADSTPPAAPSGVRVR